MAEVDSQKNSIPYQKAENTCFAKREQFAIAPLSLKGFCTNGIISEKHSGFKEGEDLFITKPSQASTGTPSVIASDSAYAGNLCHEGWRLS